jgi:general secretion pathway protein I
MSTRRGFSLLEVMVAIAILGLSLTVILSAQGGLAASNRSAANMGIALELGRCKMTEAEENLLKLGYQLTDQLDKQVPCCQDVVQEGFTCDLAVDHVELPNMNTGNSLGDGGMLMGASSALLGPNNVAGGPGLNLDVDAGLGMTGLQGMGSSLMGQFGVGGGGSGQTPGAEGLITMVMGFLYPSIKPMYEASIRRITVTVRWKEGPNDRDLPLTQFVTNPQSGGFAGSALMADGGAMDFAPTTGTTAKPGGTAAPGGPK